MLVSGLVWRSLELREPGWFSPCCAYVLLAPGGVWCSISAILQDFGLCRHDQILDHLARGSRASRISRPLM
ncbi:hypothetical protein BJY04DRAFT_173341 [Aspergillus karnatakaensis]|uniref:uncharacterized protein n=1 Tax=Aspergillus karnatakaensis TaxID=1810916 RepID=UPI003CCE2F85